MAKKVNDDGMRYPSIDALVKKDDEFVMEDGTQYRKNHTKYQLAYLAAKRARLIEEDERRKEKLLNNHLDDDDVATEELEAHDDRNKFLCAKPVGKALEEYLEDEVHIAFVSDNVVHTPAVEETNDESDSE